MRIHADHQPYRKKPYVARWYEGTRQRNKFFASAAARDEFIHQLKETAQSQDPVLPTIPAHKLMRWQEAATIAPDADPVEVYKFWRKEKLKISELGDRYLHESVEALRPRFPCKYRTLEIMASSSSADASYAIPVRRASALPWASFPRSPHSAAVALRLILPLAGWITDFHSLRS